MSRGTPTTTSQYVPGWRYDVHGMTQREFETKYAKAIPAEAGMIREPEAAAKSLIVCNLSSDYVDISVAKDEPLNPRFPPTRWNEKEVAAFPLPRGRSTHVPLSPECYIVTVGEYVIGQAGSTYYVSSKGFKLAELENVAVIAKSGLRSGQIEYIINANAEQENYFTFTNNTTRPLTAIIVRENTAYKPSQQELENQLKSRKPDNGGNKIAEVTILPKAKWTYKNPILEYTVRALQPFNDQIESSNGTVYQATIAPTDDYVDQAQNKATIGDTAIVFDLPNRDGSVEIVVYQTSELKFVSGDIVVTK